MAKKSVFISYDYDNDKHYKNLLVAWDANSEFDFSFRDHSVDVSVDSDDAGAIRRVISSRINNATYFLCIIGKSTSKSSWVDWEIKKAVELKRNVIAVKIDNDYVSPSAILNVGASWAKSFTLESIKSAIASSSPAVSEANSILGRLYGRV